MSKPLICIKIGGRVIADKAVFLSFAAELSKIIATSDCVIIHGGGAVVSEISKVFGLEPEFVDGKRMTSDAEMDVIDMVLAGKVNKQVARTLFGKGIKAAGISGSDAGMIIGNPLNSSTRTGEPSEVHPEILSALLESGITPVVSSVSIDQDGNGLNLNADDAALALAAKMAADTLVFISDIPGILDDGEVIAAMTPAETEAAIGGGVITGGMIPKVRASAGALEDGVSRVIIGGYTAEGDLHRLLSGESGTKICID